MKIQGFGKGRLSFFWVVFLILKVEWCGGEGEGRGRWGVFFGFSFYFRGKRGKILLSVVALMLLRRQKGELKDFPFDAWGLKSSVTFFFFFER